MPKADFYLLTDSGPESIFHFVCRLAQKAFRQGHRLYFHMKDNRDAHLLDEMLWTFSEESFVPHHLYGEGPEPAPPLQIGSGVIPEAHHDILVNLSGSFPDFHAQFARILEIVSGEDSAREKAREHYRLYQQKGYVLTLHKTDITAQS